MTSLGPADMPSQTAFWLWSSDQTAAPGQIFILFLSAFWLWSLPKRHVLRTEPTQCHATKPTDPNKKEVPLPVASQTHWLLQGLAHSLVLQQIVGSSRCASVCATLFATLFASTRICPSTHPNAVNSERKPCIHEESSLICIIISFARPKAFTRSMSCNAWCGTFAQQLMVLIPSSHDPPWGMLGLPLHQLFRSVQCHAYPRQTSAEHAVWTETFCSKVCRVLCSRHRWDLKVFRSNQSLKPNIAR